ncbi:MAG: hypothetical protein HOO96_11285, partial [Polyangiaceae bacterium]|nr:hypothetical protein [Polyangiaceae bacterium]
SAPIGSTKLTMTGGGSFSIGFVTNGSCLPVLTGQTAVGITVTGAAKAVCVAASNPARALNAYTLVKQ